MLSVVNPHFPDGTPSTSFDCTKNDGVNEIKIQNLGHLAIKPLIMIKKVGNGSVEILNHSNAHDHFIMTNLLNNEQLEIDCETEIITSNLNILRYDNFNDGYLAMPYGVNRLQVKGSCWIIFSYYYTYR